RLTLTVGTTQRGARAGARTALASAKTSLTGSGFISFQNQVSDFGANAGGCARADSLFLLGYERLNLITRLNVPQTSLIHQLFVNSRQFPAKDPAGGHAKRATSQILLAA